MPSAGGRERKHLLRAEGLQLPLDTKTKVVEGGPGPQGCPYGMYEVHTHFFWGDGQWWRFVLWMPPVQR